MLDVRRLRGRAVGEAISQVAALRIAVFREWPYLYDGDLAYEERYLAPLATAPEAVLIGAFHRGALVGASTAMPLRAHDDDFATAFKSTDIDVDQVFYCAESVILPEYRGQGAGHRFFDLRETAGREQGYSTSAFCAVMRPEDHPARPASYRPLDAFWRARGYNPMPGVIARFVWKDLGETVASEKNLQFWARAL